MILVQSFALQSTTYETVYLSGPNLSSRDSVMYGEGWVRLRLHDNIWFDQFEKDTHWFRYGAPQLTNSVHRETNADCENQDNSNG
jgi:hypothetical protein